MFHCRYTIFGIFNFTQEKELVWLHGTKPMLLVSEDIYSYPVAPGVFMAEVLFLAFSHYHGNIFQNF